jgi:predicted nucleotidyltransferase
VRVFGSVARSAATLKSDIDLLVEFDDGASAYDQVELVLDLQELLRRKVDVVEEGGLHWLVKPQVLHEAVALCGEISSASPTSWRESTGFSKQLPRDKRFSNVQMSFRMP